MANELNALEVADAVRATLYAFLDDHPDLSDRTVCVFEGEEDRDVIRVAIGDQHFRLLVEEAR